MCGKSIEGKWSEGTADSCGHNPREDGKHEWMYRFKVLLFDGNSGSPPIAATVFHHAQKFLGMGPTEFATLDEVDQTLALQTKTFKAPLVKAWIRIQPGFTPIVHNLKLAHPDGDVGHYGVTTPEKLHCKCNKLAEGQTSTTVSSTCLHGKMAVVADYQAIRDRELEHAIGVLSRLHTSGK